MSPEDRSCKHSMCVSVFKNYPSATRRHGNFAGVHTLLRILLSNNSAVLINIITGVSPHITLKRHYLTCFIKKKTCFPFTRLSKRSFYLMFFVNIDLPYNLQCQNLIKL
jgi:hypothetical protein